ncbi:MAG: hypothetical protein NTAFB09_28200 [Nitrosospira sp.]
MKQQALSSFIWSVADRLRSDYKQSEYGKMILSFIVLRRLDCVLEATQEVVLAEYADKQKSRVEPRTFLTAQGEIELLQQSPMDMKKLMGDQDYIKENLYAYIQGFSPAVRDIFERNKRRKACNMLPQPTFAT